MQASDETTLQRYRRRLAAVAFSVRNGRAILPTAQTLLQVPANHAQWRHTLISYRSAVEYWQSSFYAIFGVIPRPPRQWTNIVDRTKLVLDMQLQYINKMSKP